MCGIVGVVGLAASPERSCDLVGAMQARIEHRGPDGGGISVHPDATLGMRRLAIVDVEHGCSAARARAPRRRHERWA